MNDLVRSGIYQIINVVNGKRYIGSTINFSTRKNAHFTTLRHHKHYNVYLQRAWNKHGENNFKFETIEIITNPTKFRLEKREQYWLDHYRSYERDRGYNTYVTAGNPLGFYNNRILQMQKEILEFCSKNGYRPSSCSEDLYELGLASNLENFIAREHTVNHKIFKERLLRYPSKRDYITNKHQEDIIKFCNQNGYRPCEDSGTKIEKDLGSLLRAYMTTSMKRKYYKFTKLILAYPDKCTKLVQEKKYKILEFCRSRGYRPRAHSKDKQEKILGCSLGSYICKTSSVYDVKFAGVVKEFPTILQLKK